MSPHDLPDLAPPLQDLLKAGRPGDTVPDGDRTAIARAVGLLGPVPPPPDQAPPAQEPPDTVPTDAVLSGLISSKAAIAVAGIILGAIAGATGHAVLEKPSPAMLPTPSITVVVSVAPSAESPALGSSSTFAGSESVIPPSSAPPSDSGRKDHDLNAERALIDVARAALARGQPAAAMETLGRHARTFPRGRLTEEREALWIRALVMSGQSSQADQRSQQFRKNYPNSLLIPAAPSGSVAP